MSAPMSEHCWKTVQPLLEASREDAKGAAALTVLRRRRVHPDERDRVGLARLRVADRARLDHRLDCSEAASLRLRKKAHSAQEEPLERTVRVGQRGVLHLEPDVVVVLARLEVQLDIELLHREAEDLLAVQQLLCGAAAPG